LELNRQNNSVIFLILLVITIKLSVIWNCNFETFLKSLESQQFSPYIVKNVKKRKKYWYMIIREGATAVP